MLFDSSRYLVLYGGAGSGKSEFAGQKILLRVLAENNHRVVLVRKVGRTIRNSQFKLLKDQIIRYGLGDFFHIKDTEMTITCLATNSEIISVGLDDREKIKSLAQPTMIWYEEPTELAEREFRQMSMRLRGQLPYYKQEILSFNPISEHHWLRKEFFPPAIEQALKKKKVARMERHVKVDSELLVIKSTLCHTTYRDNKFIDLEYKAFLEDLKNKDLNFYNIYCLGHWGSVGNLVYTPFEIRKRFPSDDEFEEIFYGLDFGYHHPTALVKVGLRDKAYYVREILVASKLTNTDLIKEMIKLEIPTNRTIYADSAEPDRIEEIKRAGFSIKPAIKGNKSVINGIDFIKSQTVYSHIHNVRLNQEVLSYKWEEDEDGKPIEGRVVKILDDALDAMRYAIYSHSRVRGIQIAFINRGGNE